MKFFICIIAVIKLYFAFAMDNLRQRKNEVNYSGYLGKLIFYGDNKCNPKIEGGEMQLWKLGVCSLAPYSKHYQMKGLHFDEKEGDWEEYNTVFEDNTCNGKPDHKNSEVTRYGDTCNSLSHSRYGFVTVSRPFPYNFEPFKGSNQPTLLKFEIFADHECEKEIGVIYFSATTDVCLPNGETYSTEIRGGYKQSCSTAANGDILNPYTNFKDKRCEEVKASYPNNKFSRGCQPWGNSGTEIVGEPTWHFKPSCFNEQI